MRNYIQASLILAILVFFSSPARAQYYGQPSVEQMAYMRGVYLNNAAYWRSCAKVPLTPFNYQHAYNNYAAMCDFQANQLLVAINLANLSNAHAKIIARQGPSPIMENPVAAEKQKDRPIAAQQSAAENTKNGDQEWALKPNSEASGTKSPAYPSDPEISSFAPKNDKKGKWQEAPNPKLANNSNANPPNQKIASKGKSEDDSSAADFVSGLFGLFMLAFASIGGGGGAVIGGRKWGAPGALGCALCGAPIGAVAGCLVVFILYILVLIAVAYGIFAAVIAAIATPVCVCGCACASR